MAKDLRYSLLIMMRDGATAGLDKVRKGLLRIGDAAKAVRQGPGAALRFGGPVAGLLLGGLSTALHVLTGLVRTVAGIAGGILNVFVRLAAAIVKVFTGLVGTVGGILWKLVKTATVVGAGIGAAIGVALYKGISDNLKEGEIKAVLRRRIGGGWQAAWKEIERLRLQTPFSAEQLAEALVTLQRADLKRPADYLGTIADTATGAAASLTEVADIFVQMATGGGGRLPEMLRRFGFKPEQVQSIRTVADLARLLDQRFGGVNAEVNRFRPVQNIFRRLRLLLRDITSDLASYLLPLLNGVVAKLDQLRQSPAFARLKQQVKEVGQAIVQWITGREWKFENVKAGLADLWDIVVEYRDRFFKLFAEKGAGGWKMGPLANAVVSAFEWAAARIEAIFARLWVRVGEDLRNKIAEMAGSLGRELIERTLAYQEEAARTQISGYTPEEWKGLPKKTREQITTFWGVRHPIEARVTRGALATGRVLTGIGMAQELPKGAEEKAQAAREASAKADAAAAEALERLADAADRVRGEMKAPAAKAREALGRMAPKKPAGAERQLPMLGAAAAGERLAYKEAVAGLLERSGYTEQAKAARQEIELLKQSLTAVFGVSADVMKAQAAALKDLRREVDGIKTRMRNLGTARR